MLIGCDIDGVLFPWADIANKVLMFEFDIDDPGPHTTWEHLKNTISRDQWKWLWSRDGQDKVFGRFWECDVPAVNAVNQLLRSGHRVHFVTHRDPRYTIGHTALFLERWFSNYPWAGVHVVQNSVEKRRLERWDVFIDDKPETIYNFLENTSARLFAPARPWNTDLETGMGGMLTVYEDPQEIVDWVDGVEARAMNRATA